MVAVLQHGGVAIPPGARTCFLPVLTESAMQRKWVHQDIGYFDAEFDELLAEANVRPAESRRHAMHVMAKTLAGLKRKQ
jgi:hypothetical protein